jgi:hypothetical protein
MADVEVTSAELKDGVLTVSGSGFTKTTTTLYVDGASTPFETAADFDGTEITAQVESANQVYAEKGGIQSATIEVTSATTDSQTAPIPETGETAQTEGTGAAAPTDDNSGSAAQPYDPGGDVHEEGYKTAEPNATPGDLVEDDLKTTADATAEQINQGASTGAADRQAAAEANQPDREPLKEGEHLPGKDFRFKVENTAAGDLGKTIGPRDPYPKDNPPDPKEEFYRIHGYYKPEEGGGAEAAQMDADPKT